MQYNRHRSTGYYSSYFPPGVKWLLIVNTGVFVLSWFAAVLFDSDPFRIFGLVPYEVLRFGFVWQIVTYLFLHGGFGHILFNMLALWMFGLDLEREWGTRQFLKYYFYCGIAAGVCVIASGLLFGQMGARTIGSSGAIFGLLLAFGVLYPDRTVLMSFLFPIKAKYFVMIIGVIAFMSSFRVNTGISDIAHLGGLVFGYIYLKTGMLRARRGSRPRSVGWFGSLRRQYQDWKVQRARKKFQVYMRKHQSDRDRWVN
jgi:membrane associated rhomboid family serine protease